jgi:hypothetical protein
MSYRKTDAGTGSLPGFSLAVLAILLVIKEIEMNPVPENGGTVHEEAQRHVQYYTAT